MKKLLLIVSVITATLLFAEWDVDPDYDDLTVENLETDSTIIDDYFLVGDTTTADGGFVVKDNKIEIWRDTAYFVPRDPTFGYVKSASARMWIGDYDTDPYLYILNEDQAVVLCGGKAPASLDSFGIHFYHSKFYPKLDTTGYFGMPNHRVKESWAWRRYQTDASRADTSMSWMGEDTLYHESENPNKFDNAMFVDGEFETSGKILVGAGDSLTKFVKIGSHCAVIVNAADTFWLAADTTGF